MQAPALFLSYARNDDEYFVRKLYEKLTQKGFDVWFDHISMPSRGLSFNQEIGDAIRNRDRLILVVGPAALTSDYVTQEWGWAFEHEKPIIPILRSGKYADMPSQLKQLHCEDFTEDAQFEESFANLVLHLSSPAPSLGNLNSLPSLPPHFVAQPNRLQALKNVVLSDLQKPVVVTGAEAKIGIYGMGGIGKSVLATALARDRQIRKNFQDGVIWLPFGQNPDLVSLQRDLAKALGDDGLFDSEAEGKGKLRKLLLNKAVLVIMDDVWERIHTEPFDILGTRCRWLITTRDIGLLNKLGGTEYSVDLLPENDALILLAKASGHKIEDLSAEAHMVVKKCGHLPLALALCGSMAFGPNGIDWGSILDALNKAQLHEISDDQAINEKHHSIYTAINISVKRLTPDEQNRLFELAVFPQNQRIPETAAHTLWQSTANMSKLACKKLIRKFWQRSLIYLETLSTGDGKQPEHRVSFHDLIYDYVNAKANNKAALHNAILDAYQLHCHGDWASGPNDGYFFENICNHLAEAMRTDELVSLLQNLAFLEIKVTVGLSFDLPHNFAMALRIVPKEHAQWRILKLLDEALRRDIHFIASHAADYPQVLFQCLWNSCWWYDCPETAQYYDAPESGWISPPHWEEPSLKLYRIMENWRKSRENRSPGFYWLRSLRPPSIHLGTPQLAVIDAHSHKVCMVDWSPDSQLIASCSLRSIRIWDAITSKLYWEYDKFEHWISVASFSPNGQYLAVAEENHYGPTQSIYIWQLSDFYLAKQIRTHAQELSCLAWSPDSRYIAAIDADRDSDGHLKNKVKIWDIKTDDRTSIDLNPWVVRSMDWANQTLYLASAGGTDAESVHLCDRHGVLREMEQTKGSFGCLSFSHDGRRLVAGETYHFGGHPNPHLIRMWDTETGQMLKEVTAHRTHIFDLKCSPKENLFASCSGIGPMGGKHTNENIIHLWSMDDFRCIREFSGHNGSVNSIAFSPDGTKLVSGGDDQTVRIWDLTSGRQRLTIQGHTHRINSLLKYDDKLLSASDDETLRVWNPKNGTFCKTIPTPTGVDFLARSSCNTRLGLYSHSGLLLLLDARSYRRVGKLFPERVSYIGKDSPFAFAPNKNHIAFGELEDEKHSVAIWDYRHNRYVMRLYGHKEPIFSFYYSPNGRYLISINNHDVIAWNLTIEKSSVVFRAEDSFVNGVAITPDSKIFAFTNGYTLMVYQLESGEQIQTIRSPDYGGYLRFSPDGRILLQTTGKTTRFWDISSGECVKVMPGIVEKKQHGWERLYIVLYDDKGTSILNNDSLVAFVPHFISDLTYISERCFAGGSGDEYLVLLQLEGGTAL